MLIMFGYHFKTKTMKEVLFTWRVWERNGNISDMKLPTHEPFETQQWLWKEKGVHVSSLKRLMNE